MKAFRRSTVGKRLATLGLLAGSWMAMSATLWGASALTHAQSAEAGQAALPSESKVGVSQSLRDLVLPGSALQVAEIHLDTAIIARIVDSYPHGSDRRYDIVWYGLEPGDYDLGDYLKRSDGSGTDELPPIPLRVHSILSAERLLPNPVSGKQVPKVGGYRTWLVLGGIAWAFGLWAILNFGRSGRRGQASAVGTGPTLADRLRPLVESAVAGTLSEQDQAELELRLITLWRRRLNLTHESAPEALRLMRDHHEAGPLLSGLEDWLHRPGPVENVDVEQLLQPYTEISIAELSEPGGAS